MSAAIVPIAADPKRAQEIAASHNMVLLADGRMVREYRFDAYAADFSEIVAFMATHRHLLEPTPPSAA